MRFAATPPSTVTVRDLLSLIFARGMHRYMFDAAGSGCLFWTQRLLWYLEETRRVPAGSWQRFTAAVQMLQNTLWHEHWIPTDAGVFYPSV